MIHLIFLWRKDRIFSNLSNIFPIRIIKAQHIFLYDSNKAEIRWQNILNLSTWMNDCFYRPFCFRPSRTVQQNQAQRSIVTTPNVTTSNVTKVESHNVEYQNETCQNVKYGYYNVKCLNVGCHNFDCHNDEKISYTFTKQMGYYFGICVILINPNDLYLIRKS
jgi:hypothetical protein